MTITAKLAEALRVALDSQRLNYDVVAQASSALAEYEAAKGARVAAVPNDDADISLVAKHQLFVYEVDFGDEGKGRYVRLNDFNKVVSQMEAAKGALVVPDEVIEVAVEAFNKHIAESGSALAHNPMRDAIEAVIPLIAATLRQQGGLVDTARIRKTLDLLNGVNVFDEKSTRYLEEATQELVDSLAQQVDGETSLEPDYYALCIDGQYRRADPQPKVRRRG